MKHLFKLLLAAAISLYLAGCGDLSTLGDAPISPPSLDAGTECLTCEARCNAPPQYAHVDDPGDGGVPANVQSERMRVARLQVVAQPTATLAHLAGASLCTLNYVGNNLVLTAAHCGKFPTRAGMPAPTIRPEDFVANMEAVPEVWLTGGAGGALHRGASRRVVALVERNEALDYMVLRLESAWDGATAVPLGPRNPVVGESVCLTQHAGGREMVRSCGQVKEVFPTRVSHRCDTEPGSSGSCVLSSSSGACVALHVAGGCLPGNLNSSNRAIPIEAILAASATLRNLASTPVTTCTTGTTACSGRCVDLQSNPTACGACGNACTSGPNTTAATCRAGVCVSTCAAGYGDCDGNAVNGCETLTTNNPAHCGRCGNACTLPHATASCNDSTCRVGRCEPGWANCNLADADGCETRLAYDNNNCGACGRGCSAGTFCYAGACTSVSVLCSGISPCGNGTACAAGMQCVTTGSVSRCICTGTPISCATGQPVREVGPDTLCVPN